MTHTGLTHQKYREYPYCEIVRFIKLPIQNTQRNGLKPEQNDGYDFVNERN